MSRKKIYLFILLILIIFVFSFVFMLNLPMTPSNTDIGLSEQNNQRNNINNEDSENDNIYYLHKSDLKPPAQNNCYSAQAIVLEGLPQDEKRYLQKELGYLHTKIEYELINTVSILKNPESEYWSNYVDSDLLDRFTAMSLKIEELTKYIKNDKSKNDFENACELWRTGMSEHSIGKLFKAHEIIHDYDYWVINTPLELYAPAADWAGIKIYFR